MSLLSRPANKASISEDSADELGRNHGKNVSSPDFGGSPIQKHHITMGSHGGRPNLDSLMAVDACLKLLGTNIGLSRDRQVGGDCLRVCRPVNP